jgi:hypothetical protein
VRHAVQAGRGTGTRGRGQGGVFFFPQPKGLRTTARRKTATTATAATFSNRTAATYLFSHGDGMRKKASLFRSRSKGKSEGGDSDKMH